MHADLDLFCISVYCTADDLLPTPRRNARRRLSDAEVVTLCVAQVLMGIPSDRRFLRAAKRQLGHLFPQLPAQDALHKRRARLAETIEWLVGVFASRSPGFQDSLLLLDSTPVECGRSLETARRSRLAEVCGYGYSRSHSRWFWGCRLHLACAADGTPRAATLAAARPARARGRAAPARPRPARWRNDRLRQGLRRARVQRRRRQPRRTGAAPAAPRRARHDAPPGTDPAADRVGLLHLQRPALARAPRRAHTTQPQRADRPPAPRTRRLHRPQPPARPTQPRNRRLHRLTAWHQPSSVLTDSHHCRMGSSSPSVDQRAPAPTSTTVIVQGLSLLLRQACLVPF